MLVTLAIAIVGGAVIALIVRSAKHPGGKEYHVDSMYDDSGEQYVNNTSFLATAPYLTAVVPFPCVDMLEDIDDNVIGCLQEPYTLINPGTSIVSMS